MKHNINGVIIGMPAFGMVFGNQVCGAIENGLKPVQNENVESARLKIDAKIMPPQPGTYVFGCGGCVINNIL